SMSYNIMVIAEGRPQQLGLIPILRYYVEHQRNVVLRRTKFDLNNNKKRAHILEGYSLILGNIDEVIAIIKGSRTRTEAKEGLISRFELSDKQADAILDLKLANITKLEIDKVNTELVEINKKIREFEKIVNSKAEQLKVVKQEILELRNKYRVKRLTTIVDTFDNFDSTQLAVTNNAGDKRGYVVCGVKGDIKLVGNVQFLNNPGRTKPKKIQDMIKCQVFTDPSKQSFAFTDLGNCIKLDLSQMVEVRPGEDGAMPNAVASQLDTKEKFIKVLILTPEDENKNLVFYTQNGMIKKTQVSEYFINRQVFEAITLKDDDKVINVELEDESKGVLEIASNGYCLVYMPTEVNPTGRRTAGVAGMKLDKNSRVICAKQIILDDIENIPVGEVLFVCKTGYAKRAYGYEINLTKRANKGTEMIRVDNNEEIIYSDIVTNAFDVAIADENGNVNVVNSEDIGIDRHVRRKGQALAIALNAVYAIKQDSEV
ncbi:MAG: hypothetical protein K5765_04965, partial [Clostridia bacterium]|nr:hypothetical protein [Clostridia bacterium]